MCNYNTMFNARKSDRGLIRVSRAELIVASSKSMQGMSKSAGAPLLPDVQRSRGQGCRVLLLCGKNSKNEVGNLSNTASKQPEAKLTAIWMTPTINKAVMSLLTHSSQTQW